MMVIVVVTITMMDDVEDGDKDGRNFGNESEWHNSES